jgi:hypothetical protein
MRGEEFGAQSNSIDLDRYNGGLAQIRIDYPDVDWQPLSTEPVPPPSVEITIPVKKVVYPTGVRVRNKPTTVGSTIYFVLPKGSDVELIAQMTDSDGNIWARVGQRQYCAVTYNGEVLIA